MIKPTLVPILFLIAIGSAQAYTMGELRSDCQAAEQRTQSPSAVDASLQLKADRCAAYVTGFADGYGIADQLSNKLGVPLNTFCLPREDNPTFRLIRAVLAQFDRMPPTAEGNAASLVASAFYRSFACSDSLEPRK